MFRKKHKNTANAPPVRNTLRSPMVEPEAPAPAKPKKKKRKLKFSMLGWLQALLDGSLLTRESFTRALPFGIWIVFLAFIYIANSYYAIRQIRKIDTLTYDMKEYRYEHITTKSQLMFQSKPSELAKRLNEEEIKQSVKPPEKVFIRE